MMAVVHVRTLRIEFAPLLSGDVGNTDRLTGIKNIDRKGAVGSAPSCRCGSG